MIKHFSIIQSLCRACLSSDKEIGIHQIARLAEALKKDGDNEEAQALQTLIKNTSNKEHLNSTVITLAKQMPSFGKENQTQNAP